MRYRKEVAGFSWIESFDFMEGSEKLSEEIEDTTQDSDDGFD